MNAPVAPEIASAPPAKGLRAWLAANPWIWIVLGLGWFVVVWLGFLTVAILHTPQSIALPGR